MFSIELGPWFAAFAHAIVPATILWPSQGERLPPLVPCAARRRWSRGRVPPAALHTLSLRLFALVLSFRAWIFMRLTSFPGHTTWTPGPGKLVLVFFFLVTFIVWWCGSGEKYAPHEKERSAYENKFHFVHLFCFT